VSTSGNTCKTKELSVYPTVTRKLRLGAIEKRTPQGRIGEVSDLLAVAVLLACDESAFMTGSIVTVDGGWTAYGYL